MNLEICLNALHRLLIGATTPFEARYMDGRIKEPVTSDTEGTEINHVIRYLTSFSSQIVVQLGYPPVLVFPHTGNGH